LLVTVIVGYIHVVREAGRAANLGVVHSASVVGTGVRCEEGVVDVTSSEISTPIERLIEGIIFLVLAHTSGRGGPSVFSGELRHGSRQRSSPLLATQSHLIEPCISVQELVLFASDNDILVELVRLLLNLLLNFSVQELLSFKVILVNQAIESGVLLSNLDVLAHVHEGQDWLIEKESKDQTSEAREDEIALKVVQLLHVSEIQLLRVVEEEPVSNQRSHEAHSQADVAESTPEATAVEYSSKGCFAEEGRHGDHQITQ